MNREDQLLNRSEIIRMAREAGLILLLDEDCFQAMGVKNFERTKRVIERFAALVAAAERDRMCEQFNIPKDFAHEKAKSNETD